MSDSYISGRFAQIREQLIAQIEGKITGIEQRIHLQFECNFISQTEKLLRARQDYIKSDISILVVELKQSVRAEAQAISKAQCFRLQKTRARSSQFGPALLNNAKIDKVVKLQSRNYKIIVDQCHKMKEDLLAVNHTDIKELAREIQHVAADNRLLRTENNRISFEYQKTRKQLQRSRSNLQDIQRQLDRHKHELVEHKSSVNRLIQQNKQQLNDDQKLIYELNVKVNSLQEQLRGVQQATNKMEQMKHQRNIQAIEFVEREVEFRKTLSQFSRPKKNGTRNSLMLQDRDRSLSKFFQDKPETARNNRKNPRSFAKSVNKNY